MNDEERREYIRNVGKGGIKLLVIIEKLRPIIELWLNNEVGRQFLDEEIRQHVELLNRVFDSLIDKGEADVKDIITLKVTYSRLKRIGDLVNNYETFVERGKKREAAAIPGAKKRTGRITKKV